MFAEVVIAESLVTIRFSRWDKFLNASKRDISIRRDQLVSIDLGPEIVKQCQGLRAPGTYGFGVIAGTYRQRHGVKHFWNVRKKLADHTVRFNLLGREFDTSVVQVGDPKAISESLAVSIA
jgi:hypothetical protein